MLMTVEVPEHVARRVDAEQQLAETVARCARDADATGAMGVDGLADVLEQLAGLPSPQEVMTMRPSADLQSRIETLSAAQKTRPLEPKEALELQRYEYVEHLVRMAKAQAASRLAS